MLKTVKLFIVFSNVLDWLYENIIQQWGRLLQVMSRALII